MHKNFVKIYCKQEKAAQLCGWLAEYILLANFKSSKAAKPQLLAQLEGALNPITKS